MSEYIKLANPTVVYTKKQLLQSQLEFLKVLQKIDTFKKLRLEELDLKIAMKNKLNEINAEMVLYKKLMPQTSTPEEELELTPEQQIKRNSLETEIEVIKKKLTLLNG